VIGQLTARLSSTPSVADIKSPLEPGNQGQLSKDGRAALVTFQIVGDPKTAQDRVAPSLAATAAVQQAHPDLFIGQFGDGSANKAINERLAKDLSKAEITSHRSRWSSSSSRSVRWLLPASHCYWASLPSVRRLV
jgi:hypothetical protein